jgi:two-component system response regulator PilR (NtrC family)
VERDYLLKALEMSGWVKHKAAEVLGISLRSLRYRLDKLGLEKD